MDKSTINVNLRVWCHFLGISNGSITSSRSERNLLFVGCCGDGGRLLDASLNSTDQNLGGVVRPPETVKQLNTADKPVLGRGFVYMYNIIHIWDHTMDVFSIVSID